MRRLFINWLASKNSNDHLLSLSSLETMKTYAIAVMTFLFSNTGSNAFALKGRNVLRNHRDATYDSFLSHDWGVDELGRSNHKRTRLVSEALLAAGVVTFFDENDLRDGGPDTNKAMADGVKNSSCFVAFITESYLKKASGDGPNGANDNCKLEFDSALHNKDLGVANMIAVIMEPRCKRPINWPNGYVKSFLASKLYIDLSQDDEQMFKDGIVKLVKEITRLNKRNINKVQQLPSGSNIPNERHKSPYEYWLHKINFTLR
jgi:hypothetical protein